MTALGLGWVVFMRLPGCRPGKVPKQVIVQQVGIVRIKAAALETLVDKDWQDEITQGSIEAIGEAKLKEELQSLVDRFNPNENLTFEIEVEVTATQKEADEYRKD